jgi:hypothetical protein
MKSSRIVRGYVSALVVVSMSPLVLAQTIPGWAVYSEAQDVQVNLDQATTVDGKPSAHLKLGLGESAERVSFFQSLKAGQYIGRTIKIAANVKTTDFKGQVALSAATYDQSPYMYVYSQRIRDAGKAHAWQKIELKFTVPERTSLVNFGLLFKGAQGEVWLAGVEFTTIDTCKIECVSGVKSGRLTHAQQEREREELMTSRDRPQNLDFLRRQEQ